MTEDNSTEALTPAEQSERLARVWRILEERIARHRALEPEGEGEGEESAEMIRPADPALCPRPLCRRSGECHPPRSQPCADDPNERMRREIWERIVALRKRKASRAGRGE